MTYLSVCPSVCHAPSNCFFFFVSRWNRVIFGRQFSMTSSTKRFSLIFDLGSLTPKIYSPKSPISRLVWQIDRRCLGLPGGFQGWPIQWNHAECCGPTFVAMATKFGLGAEIQSPTGLSATISKLMTSIRQLLLFCVYITPVVFMNGWLRNRFFRPLFCLRRRFFYRTHWYYFRTVRYCKWPSSYLCKRYNEWLVLCVLAIYRMPLVLILTALFSVRQFGIVLTSAVTIWWRKRGGGTP